MELGIYTFGARSPDPETGREISPAQRMIDLLEEIELADQVGLDVFGIGEHHRPDYVVSAPAVVLAAASQRTNRIRLSSAVTVLSSEDPVRVFQQYATLDLLSGGRAEIMAGRGSFIESFPLFGHDLEDYDTLFEQGLELLLKIREDEKVTWPGGHRPAIPNLGVYPRPVQNPLPVWIAVGGTPESTIRAGRLGLPMGLAIIAGTPQPFVPFVRLYREAATQAGHDGAGLPVGINLHGYIANTTERAADEFWPPYADIMGRLGRERGWSPPTRSRYNIEISPKGAIAVGSPAEVTDKLLAMHAMFGNDRFLIQMGIGFIPHAQMMRSIELYGTEVAPAVHKGIG